MIYASKLLNILLFLSCVVYSESAEGALYFRSLCLLLSVLCWWAGLGAGPQGLFLSQTIGECNSMPNRWWQ